MKSLSVKILIGLALLLASCSGQDKSVTVSDRNGHPLLVMNIKNIRDSIRIKLSDLATGLRFIRLETKPECLISGATYYITGKYILARTKTGILQFDATGRFIRTLVSRGQGPMEYTTAEWVFDEVNEKMILADGVIPFFHQ